ncbi:hypothetical protein O3G_MSEX014832 [Manduca sexta]|uniref:RNA-directed DNA polymerase n=1 Tax=Manduca sexta TaxID=7130 RepID=A0A922D0X9_MANSE|nr:hypothetical protein O3G_MSEX014832 [Manduca sexta]
MPPKRHGNRDNPPTSDTDDERPTSSPVITMTEDALQSLVANIARSQIEANQLLMEKIFAKGQSQDSPTPPPDACATLTHGNFAKCTTRFDGTTKNADAVEAFIDAVQVYKECTNVNNDHALKGFPMLLTGEAAVWWQGVKASVTSWEDALRRLRGMFGVPRPAHKIFRDIFATEQQPSERADVFVSKVRALIAKLPYSVPENMCVDIIYGLLNRKLRKRVLRDAVDSVEVLLEKARLVEEALAEVSDPSITPIPPRDVPASKTKRPRPRCNYCKIFGHDTAECRNKSRNLSKPDEHPAAKPSTSDIRCYGCGQLGVVRSKCDTCKGTSKMNFQSAQVDNVEYARPTVMIQVVGQNGAAILDTGSTHSIAGPMLHQLLVRAGVEFIETHRTVGLADGSQQVRAALTCDTVVTLGRRRVLTSFIVFPGADTRTLLGRDFIMQAKVVLDLPQGSWYYSDAPHETHQFMTSYDLPSGKETELMGVDTSKFTLRDDEGTNLTTEQKCQLNALLVRKADRFATDGPPTEYAEHHIKVSEKQEPIASPPYRLSQSKKALLERELKKLLDEDIIEECESPWAANVVLVAKKDGGVRLCVDYRQLNAVTEPDRYPLPRMEDILHAAKTSNFMTTCDLRSGYFQVGVTPSHRDMTAFVTPLGTFRFKRMPMGLRNSGATFQRLVDRFKSGRILSDVTILAYLDDIIILSDTFEKHLQDLEAVLDRLKMYNLRVNREKSYFARDSVKFLGHLIVPGGIQADPDKVEAIVGMAAPQNTKHLKTFLQTSSWFRRYIPNYARTAKPLTDLLKKSATWTWSSSQQEAFEEIKELLVSAPILRQADETKPYTLRTDSSGYCLGAVLMQGEAQDERPIEYASRLLLPAERNYSTTEREALAVVWAVTKYRGYIEGSSVVVKSDHQPLRWLMSVKSPSGRLARWALTLQEFDLKIEYTPGRSNAIADTLSRPPCGDERSCDLCFAEVDLPARSPRDVRDNQLKDPALLEIIKDLEEPQEPFRGRGWSDRGFILSDGILYRYGPEEEDEETACLVVPEHERSKVLADYHDAATAGHFGVDRTLHRLRARYYWPGMKQSVADYIKRCVDCQRYKTDNRKPAGLLQTPATTRRFEVIAVDLFGPLPETADKNKWILIVEDTCTRWVELFALRNATGPECAKLLVNEVFLRYGVPRRVLSDNGVQFVSEVVQQVCHTFGITQSLTPRYHPQANPVERKNRDLKPQLSILVRRDHKVWDTHLAAIRFAMNSVITSSTGYSPAYLTFGREIRAPADAVTDMRAIIESDNVVTVLTPYLKKLSSVLLDARDVHEKNQAIQKRNADEHRRPAPDYAVGDLVLLKTQGANDTWRGQTPKFIPRRDGPYRVKEISSPTTYVLEQVGSCESVGRYHVSQLTPFVGDAVPPVKEKKRRGRPRKVVVA